MRAASSATLAPLLQSFFTDRLLQQRRASPHTIASYRDSFRLLLSYVKKRLHQEPGDIELTTLDAPFLAEFLQQLETVRGNTARTRNARLAALHSFFRYVALRDPVYAHQCQRVLALPGKRYEKHPIDFLNETEIDALLAAPDTSSWLGRRDQTLLSLAIQAGLRVSELISLRCQDVVLETGAYVRCQGKGRKERCTPLRTEVVALVKDWLRERKGQPHDPLFPSLRGGALSRDAVEDLIAKHAAAAEKRCPTLISKRISPHVLRHTTAMDLLHHGVDRSVIALWLGHESVETTQVYLHADIHLKERALSRTTGRAVKPRRFRPTDHLLEFLEGL